MSNGHYELEPKGDPEDNVEDDEIYTINRCNGSRDLAAHVSGCSGDCGTADATGLEIKLHNELRRWSAVGMVVGNVNVDGFDIACKIDTLVKLVIGHGIVSPEELDQLYRRHKLETLRGIREANEDQVRKARIASVKAPLFGPDGRPLN